MKNDNFFEKFGEIDKELIAEAEDSKIRKHNKLTFLRPIAAVAAALILIVAGVLVVKNVIPKKGKTPGKTFATRYAKDLTAAFSRVTNEKGQITEEFKKAYLDFTINMFRGQLTVGDTSGEGQNELFSPLSAYLALAMLSNGTDGDTRAELEKILGMDIESLNKALYTYTNNLYTSETCKLNIANSFWKRNDGPLKVNIKKSFLQNVVNWYDAEVYDAPFDNTTVQEINDWCSFKTDEMIKQAVRELDNVMTVLVNALCFDGKWAELYKESMINENVPFKNYNDVYSSVVMLNSRERGKKGTDYLAAYKPYDGNKYAMYIVLPNEGIDVYDFAAGLTAEKLQEIMSPEGTDKMVLIMPEFSYEVSMNMNKILKNAGALTLENSANMNNMFEELLSENIGVGVLQKTFIKNDRNGTKAAAVTVVDTALDSMPKYLEANRPFIHIIADTETGLPVFIGITSNID